MRQDEPSGVFAGGCGRMDGDRGAGGERVAGAWGAGQGVARGGVDRWGVGGLSDGAGDGFARPAAAGGWGGTGAMLQQDVFRSGEGGGASGIPDSRRQQAGTGVGAGEQPGAWGDGERRSDARVSR